MICGIPQGSMLGLDEQTDQIELKSLSKIDDSLGVKRLGELLSAITMLHHRKKSVPAV